MKTKFRMNKYLAMALGIFVALILLIIGKGTEAEGVLIANAAVVSLTDAEKQGFSEQEQKVILAVKKLTEQMKTQLLEGRITKEEMSAAIAAIRGELPSEEGKTLKQQFDELKEIARKQGTTLAELGLKYNNIETGGKSIAKVLEENEEDIQKVYSQGSGRKSFLIQVNHKGQFVARPYDETRKAGPHATVDDVGDPANVASITQTIDAASLLRLGGASPIVSEYRNVPWIFDLCNLVNAGIDMPLAMWYEEQPKDGTSAAVGEGGTKPVSQYKYDLKTATYKKEAVLLGFTEEFALDFPRLQSDILGKGRTDLVNRINTAILGRIITAATAYNTATSFKGGVAVPDVNDFDVLAAMAAQVDNATFGAMANAAVMSTFKKYRMGITKDNQGAYLNIPQVISRLAFVGNPAMNADDVLVGDMKQYNILLRGGLILRVGYNGTDFAENRFSQVLEQFYFDYIPTIRKVAIVKGTTFADVKTAIST